MDYFTKMKSTSLDIRRHGTLVKFSLSMLALSSGFFIYPAKANDVNVNNIVISQQAQTLQGKITDSKGEPIIGANVSIKGTTDGTITDVDGMFSLKVSSNAVLVVTYVGYKQQEISLKGRTNISIVLKEDNELLDEVVVVGYGTKQKKSLTASVETITTDDLQSMPVSNASGALVGRSPGLITVQTTGGLGADGTNIMIRGVGTTGNTAPLIIVDGVPRSSLNEIDVNNVKSYTVLKDAAAVAPYGIGGANGVILIETKSGSEGKPVVNYNGWVGWSKPTLEIDYANSYQYASTFDKAQEMAGVPIDKRRYSAQDLEMYKRVVNGDTSVDPNLYANSDARDYLFRDSAPMTNHSINVSGGTEFVKYYFGINNMYQEEQWENSYLNRTGLVSKLDINLSKSTKFGFSLNGWTQKLKKTQYGNHDYFKAVQEWIPTEPIEYRNSNGEILKAGRTKDGLVLSDMYNLGDYTTNKTMAMLSAYIEQTLAKGLTLKGVMSYDWTLSHNKNWSEPKSEYYLLDNSTDPYQFTKVTNENLPSLSEGMNQFKSYTYQGILTYKGKFRDHGFGALFVAEARKTTSNNFSASRSHYEIPIPELNLGSSEKDYQSNGGGSSETAQVGFVGQLSYDYKQKYLVEFTGRYDGHYYFAPGNKWGFFPAMALGWRISEESFMDNFENIDNMKLRFSVGQSGALAGAANQYSDPLVLYGNSYPIGGVSSQGIYSLRQGNPNITWEKATKYNVGFDIDMFGGQLSGKIDYFFEKRNNMLVSPSASVPTEYGIALAQINAGVMQNQGVEFEIRGHKQFNRDWSLNGGLVFTFTRNKVIEIFENEATRNDPDRSRTGRPLNSIFGYQDLGLFQMSDDKNGDGIIDDKDGFPVQKLGGKVTPGSIRYFDANGDGVVDKSDERCIGHPTIPEIIYGFNLGASWKGLSVDMLFQGAAHSNAVITGTFTEFFSQPKNITVDNLDFWTPENTDAKYPIVRPDGQSQNDILNNNDASTFYMLNMNYLRLKQLEISYTLPRKLMQKSHLISNARIYLAGTNLLTLSHTRGLMDPEQQTSSVSNNGANRGWYQPQNKTISLGVNLTF